MSLRSWARGSGVLSIANRAETAPGALDVDDGASDAAALAESPTSIEATLDALPDAVVMIGADRTVTFANAAAEQILGCAPAALTGQSIDALLQRDEHEHHLRIVEASEQRYRHLVEDAAEVFYQVAIGDDPGAATVVFVGGHCETLTGRPAEEFMLDQNAWTNAIHPDDRDEVARANAHAVETGLCEVHTYRVWNAEDQAYRWVEDQVTLMHDDAGNVVGYQGVARDVTGARANASEAAGLAEQLLAMQKLEAIGELAGGVARDFGAQLTTMLTACGDAARIVGPHHASAGKLREIAEAGQHATSLLRELLSFSRRSTSTAVEVDVNSAISRTASLLAVTLGPGVRLDLHLSSAPFMVLIDPSQLDQVIMNVALNARDAMRNGGRLSIRTNSLVLGDGVEYIRITVIDTGAGMDDATLARALDPLFTTKPDGDGTGLGLSTAQAIVTQRGGRLEIHSRPGHGTTVKVSLPRMRR